MILTTYDASLDSAHLESCPQAITRENTPRCSVDWEICQIQLSEGVLAVPFHTRHQFRNKLDPDLSCHHLLLIGIGLPIPGHWDSGTRCVQMTTMHFFGIQQ